MTILVTGAAGFVGRQLIKAGEARGLSMFALDANVPDDVSGAAAGIWLGLDLDNVADRKKLSGIEQIDGCIHLAAISTERAAMQNPASAYGVNVGATNFLLETARQNGWKRFINVSTASVFQEVDCALTELPEDTIPSPLQCYAVTKRCGEMLTSLYRAQFDVPAASVRLTGVYGPPRVPKGQVAIPIAELIKRALFEKVVSYPSGGDWANSYTYVEDAAAGILALYEAPTLSYDTYHLGPGCNTTVCELARLIEEAIPDARIELGGGSDPWGKALAARPPISGSRLYEDTGFTPRVSLTEGIQRFADWMNKELSDL